MSNSGQTYLLFDANGQLFLEPAVSKDKQIGIPARDNIAPGRRFAGRILLFVVNEAAFFLSHRLPIGQTARAEGFEVHVATPASADVERIVKEGFQFHPIPLSRGGVNPFRDFQTFLALLRLLRRLRPDILHTVTIKPVIYGGIAARVARIPAVVSAISGLGYVFVNRGWRTIVLRWLVQIAWRLALRHRRGRVIVQNPEDRRCLTSTGTVPESATVLIKGSGVDLDLFRPREETSGPPLVVLASRMLWGKGVGEFVEAAAILRKSGTSARFALVGDVDLENPASVSESQLEGWHRSGVIEWWGFRKDMNQVFCACHIVCLPSYREGLPKVLIEAAACARPVVTTDVPGCREIVQHGENGLLVPVRDTNALAGAIRLLITNPDMRLRLGRQGRKIAETEFSVKTVIRDTLSVYELLLKAS